MKCQHCHKQAILHVTELISDDHFEELHLCDDCAQKYLFDSPNVTSPLDNLPMEEASQLSELNEKECEVCGLKFVEFRNTGRLGCPHDYNSFQFELTPLLESIHGGSLHEGKVPRRQPEVRAPNQELTQLRKKLQTAVVEEDYEEAARLRDRIRELEQT